MQHFREMTFASLCKRAAETVVLDSVCDYIDRPEDLREVTVFLEHDQSSHGYGDDHFYRLEGKEVIGVALADLDDPNAVIEILNRDQAVQMFGWRWVEARESME